MSKLCWQRFSLRYLMIILNERCFRLRVELKDLFEFILAYISLFLLRSKIELGEPLFRVTAGKEIINIYHNDNLAAVAGYPKRMPGGMVTINAEDELIIIINKKLLESERWFLTALIQHMVGHIVIHFPQLAQKDFSHILAFILKQQAEMEADEYAMKRDTEILRTLKEWSKYRNDLQKRIEHLEDISRLYKCYNHLS